MLRRMEDALEVRRNILPEGLSFVLAKEISNSFIFGYTYIPGR